MALTAQWKTSSLAEKRERGKSSRAGSMLRGHGVEGALKLTFSSSWRRKMRLWLMMAGSVEHKLRGNYRSSALWMPKRRQWKQSCIITTRLQPFLSFRWGLRGSHSQHQNVPQLRYVLATHRITFYVFATGSTLIATHVTNKMLNCSVSRNDSCWRVHQTCKVMETIQRSSDAYIYSCIRDRHLQHFLL